MKTNKLLTLLSSLLISTTLAFGQEFEPNGSPHIRVFTNFHSTITDGVAQNAFEIQRAYLGYGHNFTKSLSGSVMLDVGDPGVGKLNMTAYLKNAYLQYKSGRITAQIGMIGLYQFKLQESLWGGRYLYKSFMDEHKIGPSADLGAFVAYKISSKLSADITIANGEGYKLVQQDSLLKYSVGATFTPVKGLDLRASYDYMGMDAAQQTISLYAGYSVNKMKVGAEYIQQLNHKMADGEDLNGLSFYGSYSLKKMRLFGRFDQLSSPALLEGNDPWNFGKDGRLIIAGLEFSPTKGINMTPNYQLWMPADGGSNIHIAYLSFLIKF